MKIVSLVVGLLLCIASSTNAQDSVAIKPHNYRGVSDTTRLNPRIDMLYEFTRPPIYNVWFKAIADCEGLPMPPQAEIDKLQFFIVNSEAFSVPADSSGLTYDAITNARGHVMILSIRSIWDYDVVAHEFLHFVLWYTFGSKYSGPGKNNHPTQYFGHCNIRQN